MCVCIYIYMCTIVCMGFAGLEDQGVGKSLLSSMTNHLPPINSQLCATALESDRPPFRPLEAPQNITASLYRIFGKAEAHANHRVGRILADHIGGMDPG